MSADGPPVVPPLLVPAVPQRPPLVCMKRFGDRMLCLKPLAHLDPCGKIDPT